MSGRSLPFEADLDPTTGAPRVRFNFANGWSASVVLRHATAACDPCRYDMASVACAPTGKWGRQLNKDGTAGASLTELGETEASPDEVVEFLAIVMARPEIGA